VIEGRVLVDGGLVNPLPFDLLKGDADITVAIDVSGAARGPGKRPKPSAIEVLMASSQILQRSIVREKLQATQPDIYIDVAVDAFTVLDFLRFRDVLKAAIPAKEQLKRQLGRILSAQTLPSIPPSAPTTSDSAVKPARKRLASLKRLARPRAG
jgi:NTE family protein